MSESLLQINYRILENWIGDERVSNIIWCLGIIIATLLLKRPLSVLIARASSGIANRFSDKRHGKLFRDLTVRPVELLLQTLLYYVAVNQLSLFLSQVIFRRLHGDKLTVIRISDVADGLFILLLIGFLILVVSRVVDFIFYVLTEKAYEEDNREKEQLFPLVKEIVKILVWTIGLFWILGSVFHVNIPALVTGLGIGGVAIALAAKESVENFFAAFTILTDKPFQTGDAVKLGTLEGSVERIGFRSTRLRNADGSLFIIPNKKLVGENLENLTERDTRRARIVFSLKYGISHDALRELIAELKAMVSATLHVKEPVHVMVEGFGENSFQLVLTYHLPEPLEAGANADAIRQEISLRAYKIVAAYTVAGAETTDSPREPSGKDVSGEEKKEEEGSL